MKVVKAVFLRKQILISRTRSDIQQGWSQPELITAGKSGFLPMVRIYVYQLRNRISLSKVGGCFDHEVWVGAFCIGGQRLQTSGTKKNEIKFCFTLFRGGGSDIVAEGCHTRSGLSGACCGIFSVINFRKA